MVGQSYGNVELGQGGVGGGQSWGRSELWQSNVMVG